jgi:hypothetical protein
MKKKYYQILLVLLFLIAQVGVWMGLSTINEISNETGFLECIPEITSENLCIKLTFYKTIFWIGAAPIILMLIFRKKIISDR